MQIINALFVTSVINNKILSLSHSKILPPLSLSLSLSLLGSERNFSRVYNFIRFYMTTVSTPLRINSD